MKQNNLTYRAMSDITGMSPTGFKQTIDNKSLKVDTLMKIAVYFNKPISFFFDESPESIDSIAAEPSEEYGFKGKYYELLEKYADALEKINILTADKDKSPKKTNPNIYNT